MGYLFLNLFVNCIGACFFVNLVNSNTVNMDVVFGEQVNNKLYFQSL
jgi:hypothetical protein